MKLAEELVNVAVQYTADVRSSQEFKDKYAFFEGRLREEALKGGYSTTIDVSDHYNSLTMKPETFTTMRLVLDQLQEDGFTVTHRTHRPYLTGYTDPEEEVKPPKHYITITWSPND